MVTNMLRSTRPSDPGNPLRALQVALVILAVSSSLPLSGAEKLTPEQAVKLYGQAWSEPDEAKRRALLERAWADDGVYTDPTAEVNGREALVKHIGAFLDSASGRIVLTSKVDHHHGTRLRFTWQMQTPDGTPVTKGIDYGELDEDGRLKLIVGFFGPYQPLDSD